MIRGLGKGELAWCEGSDKEVLGNMGFGLVCLHMEDMISSKLLVNSRN